MAAEDDDPNRIKVKLVQKNLTTNGDCLTEEEMKVFLNLVNSIEPEKKEEGTTQYVGYHQLARILVNSHKCF